MSPASFHRARHFARRTGGLTLAINLLSVATALAFVAMILVTGLIVELLISGGHGEAGRDSTLAAWSDPDKRASDGALVFQDAGLVPWAARLEGTFWEKSALELLERLPGLRSNSSCLAILVSAALLLAAGFSVCLLLHDRVVLVKAAWTVLELRRAIYAQAHQLGGAELASRQEPAAVDLFAERIESVRHGLITWWKSVPRMAASAALLLATAAVVHVWLAIAAILMAFIGWTIYSWCESRVRYRRALLGERVSQEMALLVESLRKVRLVRGLSLPAPPGQPLTDTLARHQRAVAGRDFSESLLDPLAALLILGTSVVVLALAGANILQQPPRISFAAATVLYLALAAAWMPVRRLYRLSQVVRRANSASAAVFRFLDREPKIGQLPQAVPVKRLSHRIEFEGVTFSDSTGRRLLDELSFKIAAGSSAAIVCTENVTGKVVASLLGRFIDPAAGRIFYDQHELRGVTLDSLRRQLALVMQGDWVFTGSVADNVSCGDMSYSGQQVLEMARRVHVYDAIQRLPHGFATIIGEHGLQLPTLACWRVALARALLRDPSIVVIEEPADELGDEDSPGIDETLREFIRGRTALFLPARLATLRGVDRVFLVHEGKLQASGTHAELLEASELYRHWNYVRFNPFRKSMATSAPRR